MYSPKIKEELVVKLYHLRQEVNKPMTKLVSEAIEEYLIRQEILSQNRIHQHFGDELSAIQSLTKEQS